MHDASPSEPTTNGVLAFWVRRSPSPYVERVWRARSADGGAFTSIAAANTEIVIERGPRQTALTLRGPESAASTAECPPDTEWLGIRLTVGTYFRSAPSARIRDGRDVTVAVEDDAFVLEDGVELPLPHFEDAEAFVRALASAGFLRSDPVVEAVVAGSRTTDRSVSTRTIQRRFALATGLSNEALRQIERARFAAHLLRRGCDVADVVFLGSFVDQAHLGRSLRRYVGMTPAALKRGDGQLSLLYKTDVLRGVQSAP